MRRLYIAFALVALALCSVQAQNLDQILKDHYKASGLEKLSKINTMITKGKNTYVTAGISSAFTLYQASPNLLGMQADFMGSKIIYAYNGTTGWMYAPTLGISEPQEMGTDELKAILDQIDFETLLWNYEEKGSTVELVGSSEDGSSYLIKLTDKEDASRTILIDKKSSLMTSFSSVQVVGGAEVKVEVTLKDYKSVNGIQTPHHISTKMDGEAMLTLVIETKEYNKEIDPALFEKPVVE
jgi:hypothetical protein